MSLASVTVIGDGALDSEYFRELSDAELEADVRRQLEDWFEEAAEADSTTTTKLADWKLLRIYRIPYAQGAQTPPIDMVRGRGVKVGDVFVCGDHRDTPTVNGALRSGRIAAELVLQELAM